MAVRIRVILAFASIFIVWGSTYLAIRYAVEEIPPLLTAAVRHLVAGAILLFWARSKGRRATSVEWRHSAVVGVLFFLIGHGTLHWAEQSVPSGLSALLVATEPVWIAVLLALTGAARLSPSTIAGLFLGLGGVWLLVGDHTIRASEALLTGSVAILLGAASWALGVIYAQNAPLPANPTLRTATTLLCGSGWLLLASALVGEFGRVRVPSPTRNRIVGLSDRVWLHPRLHGVLLVARPISCDARRHAHLCESGGRHAARMGHRGRSGVALVRPRSVHHRRLDRAGEHRSSAPTRATPGGR